MEAIEGAGTLGFRPCLPFFPPQLWRLAEATLRYVVPLPVYCSGFSWAPARFPCRETVALDLECLWWTGKKIQKCGWHTRQAPKKLRRQRLYIQQICPKFYALDKGWRWQKEAMVSSPAEASSTVSCPPSGKVLHNCPSAQSCSLLVSCPAGPMVEMAGGREAVLLIKELVKLMMYGEVRQEWELCAPSMKLG